MPLGQKLIPCAIIFVALFFSVPFQCVAAEESGIVRVGYYEDGDYMYHNTQGEYEGYNFEFLQEISKLSGLRYDVVDALSWQNALQLLIDGKIDVLPAVYRTESRTEQMLFTDQPMCNIYTVLNVRMDDTRYDYEDFDAFQGMRVGIIRGGEDGENFKRYCQEHSVELTIVDYDETDELLGALEDGTLDGVAITHLGRSSIFRSVAQFSPTPLYIAVSKQRPELLAQINRAINDILLRNPGYQMDLYDKYLAPSNKQTPVLTKEEGEYIQSIGSIRISYDPDFAPLTYRDEKGNFKGVVADLFSMISEWSDLSFEFEAASAHKALEALQQGEIHAICVADGDYLWDERNDMNSTLYYLKAPSMLITSSENNEIKTLALPEGYQLSEQIIKDNPNQEICYFPSVKECFDAVLAGTAQATYVNTYVANYLLCDLKYEDLKATTLTQYSSDLCIGVSKSSDPRLFSILDKYIQHLANEQMDNMVLKHSVVPQQISVEVFVRQHSWLVVGVVAAVMGSVILLLCINLYTTSRSNRRIQNLLYRDGLTGLDNLNRFYARSKELLQRSTMVHYAILYCDIDRFKLINDNFGFDEGDRLLCAFGNILQQAVCTEECCARISADNFVLLIKYEVKDVLKQRLEEISESLESYRKDNGAIPYEIGLSFGIYLVDSVEQQSIQRMMDLANYARCSIKETPSCGIAFYDEQIRKKALFEQELEGGLSNALEYREFEAYFQPKMNMATGELVGSEALVRWNSPAHGLLMPGAFIPFFERKGKIVQLDFYMFEAVCRTIRGWLDRGLPVTTVSCNFSQLHFSNADFVEQLVTIADQYAVPHNLLEVEITESTLADAPEGMFPMLAAIKRLGLQIAIDDFGSGYSSLGQLQRLRVDVLKLDRSFVRDGMQWEREQIVIRNLVNMAKELGMAVICEGVETEEQAQVLQKLGCFLAQGFYYHRPMPVKAFEELMMSTVDTL